MRIVFDQGIPQPLRRHLQGHSVDTVYELGWSTLQNGALLDAAEQAGYDLFITTDQNLRYQQNLTGRNLAILVLMTTSWPQMRPHSQRIQQAIDAMQARSYRGLECDVSP